MLAPSTIRSWFTLTAMLAVPAQTLDAQGVCSAPHSSPVLANGGAISTLDPWAGWIQVSAVGQTSREFFNGVGDRQPYLSDGRVRTYSLLLTGAIGVLRGLDVWVQVPIHDLQFTDQTGERHRTAVGDPRAAVRLSPRLVGVRRVPVSVRAGMKLPGTDFPVDPALIPVSEGQRDWELALETGQTFGGHLRSWYVLGWVGYRWREVDEQTGRKPGDELFAHVSIGRRWRALNVDLAVDVLRGRPSELFGLALETGRRRLLQLTPTVGYGIGPGRLEVSTALPVTGSNLPTGMGTSVGYRFAWSRRSATPLLDWAREQER